MSLARQDFLSGYIRYPNDPSWGHSGVDYTDSGDTLNIGFLLMVPTVSRGILSGSKFLGSRIRKRYISALRSYYGSGLNKTSKLTPRLDFETLSRQAVSDEAKSSLRELSEILRSVRDNEGELTQDKLKQLKGLLQVQEERFVPDSLSVMVGQGRTGFIDYLKAPISDIEISEIGGDIDDTQRVAVIEKVQIVGKKKPGATSIQLNNAPTAIHKLVNELDQHLLTEGLPAEYGVSEIQHVKDRNVFKLLISNNMDETISLEVPAFEGDLLAERALSKHSPNAMIGPNQKGPITTNMRLNALFDYASRNIYVNRSNETIWPIASLELGSFDKYNYHNASSTFERVFRDNLSKVSRIIAEGSSVGDIQNKLDKLITKLHSSATPANRPEWSITFESVLRYSGQIASIDIQRAQKAIESKNYNKGITHLIKGMLRANPKDYVDRAGIVKKIARNKGLLDEVVNTINWGRDDNLSAGEFIRHTKKYGHESTKVKRLKDRLKYKYALDDRSIKIITNLVSPSSYVKGYFNLVRDVYANYNKRPITPAHDKGLSLQGVPLQEVFPEISEFYNRLYGKDIQELIRAEFTWQGMIESQLSLHKGKDALVQPAGRRLFRMTLADTPFTKLDQSLVITQTNNGLIFNRRKLTTGFGAVLDTVGPREFLASIGRVFDHHVMINSSGTRMDINAKGPGKDIITAGTVENEKLVKSIMNKIRIGLSAGIADPDSMRLKLTAAEVKSLGIKNPKTLSEIKSSDGHYHVLFSKMGDDAKGNMQLRIFTPTNLNHVLSVIYCCN